MKSYLGCKVAWILYYMGDFTSRVMDKTEASWLYGFYNWCMTKSSQIQDWSNNPKGPWQESSND